MRWRDRWDAYWFAPAPLVDLAVCRLVVVATRLWWLQTVGPWRWVDALSTFPNWLFNPPPLLHLLMWPVGWHARPSAVAVQVIMWVVLITGAMALIGWRTRVTMPLFALGNLFFGAYKYSFNDLHHDDALFTIALVVLALSPCGEALSWDSIRRRAMAAGRQARWTPQADLMTRHALAGWPLRLIQWMFVLVYASAGISKWAHGGLHWLNGYTLQYYLLQDGLRWDSSLGVWLSQYHLLALVLSWVTVLFESTFVLAVIWPRLAWIYLPVGALLHVGITYSMRADFTSYIVLYAAFVPWHRMVAWLAAHRPRPAVERRPELLFDGLCSLCRRTIAVLQSCDWFGRLVYSPLESRWPQVTTRYPQLTFDACQREMHLLLPDGTVRVGFLAFRRLLQEIPALWPVLALFYLPGASMIGPRIYRAVAARRPRLLACTPQTCPTKPGPTPKAGSATGVPVAADGRLTEPGTTSKGSSAIAVPAGTHR